MLMNALEYLSEVQAGQDPFQKPLLDKTERCSCCKVPLQEAITGYRTFGGKTYCSDDYFEEMGRLVEQHPVGLPFASVVSA